MSDRQTTENLFEAIQNFTWPEPKPIFYRLYHDAQGQPLFYSMEDMPGTYIEVDQATYAISPYNVKVIQGKLMFLQPVISVVKLCPDLNQGIACHKNDVCVVVDSDSSYQLWRLKTNDIG